MCHGSEEAFGSDLVRPQQWLSQQSPAVVPAVASRPGRCAVMLVSPWAAATQPPCVLPPSPHTHPVPWLGSGLGLEFCQWLTLESKPQGLLQGDMDIVCNCHQTPPPVTNPTAFLLAFHRSIQGARTIQIQPVTVATLGSGKAAAVASSALPVAEGCLLLAGEESLARSRPVEHLPRFSTVRFILESGAGSLPRWKGPLQMIKAAGKLL